MAKGYRLAIGLLVAGLLALGVRACQQAGWRPGSTASDAETTTTETGLTLRDVTLEQPDEQGELLWKVDGEQVTYSPDRQVAYVTAPDGEFYQDGELIYRVKADSGEIRENGQVIFLRGNIVATGVESQVVLRGNELEWRPEADRLVVSQGITGDHPKLQARAQRAEVFNREKRLVLEGTVKATTVVKDPEIDPLLKLQAQRLEWFWQEERLETDQSLRVERFQDDKITDFVTGDRGQVDLASLAVRLQQNVEVQLLEFPLQVTSEAALWQVPQEQLQVQQPLRLVQPEENVVVTAQSGRMDLANEQIYLRENVQAQGQENQAQLLCDRLRWDLPQETVIAEGNVRYQQVDPQLRLQGQRAVGRIQDQTLVFDGERVVTEIVPDDAP